MTTSVAAAVGAILFGLLFLVAGVTFVVSDDPAATQPDPFDTMTQNDTGPLLPGRIAFAVGFLAMGALALVWGGHALYARSR